MDKRQTEIFQFLFAKYLSQKNDYSGAILILKSVSEKPSSILFSISAPLYIDSLLNAGLKFEALNFYGKFGKVIEQNMDWEKLNDLLVKLSAVALSFNNQNLALSFLKKPLLFYPLEQSGRDAMDILSKVECSGGSLGSLYFREENMQYLSREVYKRIGKQEDSRNFILSLVGINPDKPVPLQKVDSLSLQEKERLLGVADLLVSAREYPLANKVLSYLVQSEIYSESFSRDKILDLRGRVFNSLQLPTQAAESYKELFTNIPRSKLADTAKIKYSTSLHFAGKHYEATLFASKNNIYPTKEEQDWFLFWEYYLSSRSKDAIKTAKDFLAFDSQSKVLFLLVFNIGFL